MQVEQVEVFTELIQGIRRLNENLEAQNTPRSDWVEADEAARIVGLRVVKSGNHRNRLTRACKRGIITQFIPGRPYRFHRSELEEISRRIADGMVVL